MSKIVRVMGYSPKKDEKSNPVLKDFIRAFRNYKAKSRIKPMKPNMLDYAVFLSVTLGIFLILLSFLAGRIFGIVGGVMVAFAFLSEILSLFIR